MKYVFELMIVAHLIIGWLLWWVALQSFMSKRRIVRWGRWFTAMFTTMLAWPVMLLITPKRMKRRNAKR